MDLKLKETTDRSNNCSAESAESGSFAYSIRRLTFSDGSEIELPTCGVVVLAGPNNVGKSQALRDIAGHIRAADLTKTPVVTCIEELRNGTADDLFKWICTRAHLRVIRPGETEALVGVGIQMSSGPVHGLCKRIWTTMPGMGVFGRAVAVLLDTRTRLSAADPVTSYDAVLGRPTDPIQALFDDSQLELRVSEKFRSVFGVDLRVNRLGGSHIHLHVGRAADPAQYGGELTVTYQKTVRELPLLHEQGDGMRSYAACLLNSEVVSYPILLIDEPEAFLHPPQARALAQDLAATTRSRRSQVFLATHSSDVLRGLLAVGDVDVSIIRLRREDERNIPSQISPANVKTLWTDPLLRASNLLDGLFHARVCLCEADTDVRFYNAMLDALCESRRCPKPDLMFTHCNGKHRMGSVVRALRAVDVPVTIIADIDLLNSETPLRAIWEGLGRVWLEIEKDWRIVERAVVQTRSIPSVGTFREQIEGILRDLPEGKLTADAIKRIHAAISHEGGWREVKRGGETSIPKGTARSAYERLRQKLSQAGIFLVPVGELEGFLPMIGGKGPAWVNEAVQYDLANAPELADARAFVEKMFLAKS